MPLRFDIALFCLFLLCFCQYSRAGNWTAPIETTAEFHTSSTELGGPTTTPIETTSASGCGDGILEGVENCDDANLEDGDGCSENCTVELGFSCSENSAGLHICSLSSSPQPGDVFVRISTSLAGLTAAEFIGAVRLGFRQGVADALSIPLAQVRTAPTA